MKVAVGKGEVNCINDRGRWGNDYDCPLAASMWHATNARRPKLVGSGIVDVCSKVPLTVAPVGFCVVKTSPTLLG